MCLNTTCSSTRLCVWRKCEEPVCTSDVRMSPPPPPAAAAVPSRDQHTASMLHSTSRTPRLQEKITDYFNKQAMKQRRHRRPTGKDEAEQLVALQLTVLEPDPRQQQHAVQIANCDSTVSTDSDPACPAAESASRVDPARRDGVRQCAGSGRVEPDSTTDGQTAGPTTGQTDGCGCCCLLGTDSGCCSVSGSSPDSLESADSPAAAAVAPPAGSSTAAVIRFPARRAADPLQQPADRCLWQGCGRQLASVSRLLEHLHTQHVQVQQLQAQDGGRSLRCLWRGCKVYDRPGSAAWLERHVLAHGGSKPFRCIVTGCLLRFSSQTMLERHVNSHFNLTSPVKRSDSGSKLPRKSRRAVQDQHPYSARIYDFCDASVMERLHHRVVEDETRLSQLPPIVGRAVQLTAQVLARRCSADGKSEVLVTWLPPDIVDDRWIAAGELRPTQLVPCWQLAAGPLCDLLPGRRTLGRRSARKVRGNAI